MLGSEKTGGECKARLLRRHVEFSIPEALGGSLGPVLNPRAHRNPVAIFTSNRNLGRIFVADEFLVQLFRRFGREIRDRKLVTPLIHI